MAVSMVKVRAFFGAVFAVIVLVGFLAVGLTAMGLDLPILSDIAGLFGVQAGDGTTPAQ
jgi:hypothetical protein